MIVESARLCSTKTREEMRVRNRFIGITRVACVVQLLALAACGGGSQYDGAAQPHFKVGAPYRINGNVYRPRLVSEYEVVGVASWYGRAYHGRLTSNGEVFDMNAFTAAHPTLPLPSLVEVTNLRNGRSMVLRVNDRGPFIKNRVIDLSRAAAGALGFERDGLARVHVRFLGLAPLDEAVVALDAPPRRWDRPARLIVQGEHCAPRVC